MIKMILAFLFAFGIFYVGIQSFRSLTNQEQWALTKVLSYSILCALMAMVLLIAIVVLF